jgi:hypothetical protein
MECEIVACSLSYIKDLSGCLCSPVKLMSKINGAFWIENKEGSRIS